MLSSVLQSERAIAVNIAIMRTFVRLRQLLTTHADLAHRLEALEWRQAEQEGRVQYVFETIQQLMEARWKNLSNVGSAFPRATNRHRSRVYAAAGSQ